MALVTPIVNNIPAFDATESTEVTFTANGGDQIVKNEIQVIISLFDIDLLVLPKDVTALGSLLLKEGFKQGNIRNDESPARNDPFQAVPLPKILKAKS